jgi:SWI/SNF-related matrix-associated actin-dependent regulator 1 of chromatin subfamily A
MRLVREGDRYVAVTRYEEREIPKRAGFLWDPDRRHWWTRYPERAAQLAKYADEPLRSELLRIADRIRHTREASRATDADVQVPAPNGLEYYPYQKASIKFLLDHPATLLADEMGLGKTIQAVGLINADTTIRTVLVICPASLKLNWQRELERWLVRSLTVGVADARTLPRTDVVVVNYDVLDRHEELFRRPWDLLVVDEAHYVKNKDAKRTQLTLAIASNARRKVFMTGTPIVNRPIELWTLISALDPQNWPKKRFWWYARRYCNAVHNGYGWDLRGAAHLDELQDRLRSTIMIRRLKKDVLTELPPKVRQVIVLPANGLRDVVEEERRIWSRHEGLIEEIRAHMELAHANEDEESYRAALEQLRSSYRYAFTEISEARHRTALAKVPYVVEHLRAVLEEQDKVVIWAHHTDVIRQIASAFGNQAVMLTGETPLAERQRAIDRFQTDPNCRLFVGSITAGGVGITLTAASVCVFAELDWVPGNLTQAEDRLHRIGQRNSVLVQHLVVDGSIDAQLAHSIVAKQKIIDQAMNRFTGEKPQETETLPEIESQTPAQVTTEKEFRMQFDERDIRRMHEALKQLAWMDPDRAREQNAMGFNKFDSVVGHSLAQQPSLTQRQAVLAWKILRKYHRQIGKWILEVQPKEGGDGSAL